MQMDAKYVDWVRAKIKDHSPDPSEPDRVQVLALAAYNLTKGAGTLFGLHWPPSGLGEVDRLRDEALEQLGRWFECLDDHDAVETAKFIVKHNLQVPVPPPIIEQLRRVESREGLELPDAESAEIDRMARRIAAAPTALKTSWLNVQATAQATMLALQRLEWPHEPFMVEPPATAAHLAAVESELQVTLPDAFVHVMGLWGRTAYFTWSIPPEARASLPEGTGEVGDGGFELGLWDLGRVIQMKTQCEVWRDVGQHEPGTEGYLRWDNALPFAGEDGRYFALELGEDPTRAPVVFLHNDQDPAQGHGWRLADSFTEFLMTWAQLGFPGEGAQSLAPFRTSDGLSLQTEAARRWRDFLYVE